MFISKKKYKELEKRVADLEGQVRSQQGNVFVPKDSEGNDYSISDGKVLA